MNREKTLFTVVLGLLVCTYLPLIFAHRMPPGHDTWQYLSMQYDFLNQKIQNGTIPQWLPFMTHGTIANWWFGVQAGLLQLICLTLGKVVSSFNFFTLFYAGLLFDEMILFIGIWFLSNRYFKTLEARFFVAIAIVGSTIWMDQVWLNFHSFYTFPILLEFLHRFFEKKSFFYLFLSGNLLAFHAMGGLPYFIPYIAFLIFVYFLIQFLINKKNIYTTPFQVMHWKDSIWILLSIFSFIYIYFLLKNGASEVVLSNLGRSATGGTSELSSFLEIGGYTSLHKFLEMLTGVSTSLNQTMYAGVLIIPFVIVALTNNLNKTCLHLVLFSLVLILLSIGANSFLSSTSYFAWSGMKMMRYLGLTGSFSKIFLCCIAGFGIDFIVLNPDRRPKLFGVIILLMFAMIALFLAQCAFPGKNILGLEFYHRLTLGRIYDDPIALINRCLVMAFYFALGAIALISLQDSGKRGGTGLILLLVIHSADIFGYKFHLNYAKSVELNRSQYELFQFQKFDYPSQRISDYRANERYMSLQDAMFRNVQIQGGIMDLPNDRYPPTGQYGSLHWCYESFFNIDSVQSPFRTDYWQKPLDELMRVYWKWPNPETNPGLLKRKFVFPFENSAVEKMAGYTLPKIQFFRDANMGTDSLIKSFFENSNDTGDQLWISNPSSTSATTSNFNSRINLPFIVKDFGWDFIQIHLTEPLKAPLWLYYSDVWHPSWKGTVNQKEVPIWKANLAYKAIQLNPGDQDILLRFHDSLQSFLLFLAQMNAWFWAILFLRFFFLILLT